jgi:hypothetical protein
MERFLYREQAKLLNLNFNGYSGMFVSVIMAITQATLASFICNFEGSKSNVSLAYGMIELSIMSLAFF